MDEKYALIVSIEKVISYVQEHFLVHFVVYHKYIPNYDMLSNSPIFIVNQTGAVSIYPYWNVLYNNRLPILILFFIYFGWSNLSVTILLCL